MNKTAVDKATKSYWSDYFKDYGQMWVRDIPRRIKQAARRAVKATDLEGVFRPIAKEVAADGTLSIEAAFAGEIKGQKAGGFAVAVFDKDGTMQEFNFHQVK